ncbi:hypothetical protein ACWGJ9_11610 [Curtobacterium citreum]
MGPIAINGRTADETDDLAAAFTLSDGECPAAPETQFWLSGKGPNLIVTDNHGAVSGVAIGDYEPGSQTSHGPTTKAGAGVGTSLTELQRMYPTLAYAGTYLDERAAYSMWRLDADGGPIVFQLGDDGVHVGMVWVSSHPLPYEFCG